MLVLCLIPGDSLVAFQVFATAPFIVAGLVKPCFLRDDGIFLIDKASVGYFDFHMACCFSKKDFNGLQGVG